MSELGKSGEDAPPQEQRVRDSSRSRSASASPPRRRERSYSPSPSPRRRHPSSQNLSTPANRHLFIGNLPYSVGEDELKVIVGDYGRVVNVRIGRERDTGRSRGFAFVEMETEKDAIEAHRKLTGFTLDMRTLRVDFDVGKEEKMKNRDTFRRPRAPYRRYSRSPPRRYRRRSYSRSPRRSYSGSRSPSRSPSRSRSRSGSSHRRSRSPMRRRSYSRSPSPMVHRGRQRHDRYERRDSYHGSPPPHYHQHGSHPPPPDMYAYDHSRGPIPHMHPPMAPYPEYSHGGYGAPPPMRMQPHDTRDYGRYYPPPEGSPSN
eukprot:TRINITY_DN2207_c0_g1_i1.p1 TRINITY_DN2207_c0_g1~~TRINITY_DN2207_c0_g1_i1.p1  ORF type:complete len:316 (-),score=64.77 TRINITY_DN2207_c0_g1_i1:118-1065(-)